MPTLFQRVTAAVMLGAVLASAAAAQEIRLANGTPVQGSLVQVKPEGLEIQTPAGPRVLTWETLSAGTRFRYQEAYRLVFSNILAGASAAERAAAYDARKSAPGAPPAEEPKEPRKK